MWLSKVARGYRALLNSIRLLVPSSAAHRPHSLFLAVHLPTLNRLAMSSSDDNALIAYVATMWVSHPRLILLKPTLQTVCHMNTASSQALVSFVLPFAMSHLEPTVWPNPHIPESVASVRHVPHIGNRSQCHVAP